MGIIFMIIYVHIVLIVSEMLTIIGTGNLVKTWLGFFEICVEAIGVFQNSSWALKFAYFT